MVISYNQNLHTLEKTTQEKKSQFISSYSNTTNSSHNNMNKKLTIEIYASLYYWKHESKCKRIPCFVEKIPKQELKSMVSQNIIYGFLLQVLTTPTFPKNFISNNLHLFSITFSFWTIPSHITMIKNNKNSKFKLTKFPNQSLS
jgi:hypothetical protein